MPGGVGGVTSRGVPLSRSASTGASWLCSLPRPPVFGALLVRVVIRHSLVPGMVGRLAAAPACRTAARRRAASLGMAPALAARRAPESRSSASGGLDSGSQSRSPRSRAPAPYCAQAPGGSAAPLASTACHSGSPSRWTGRASPRAATPESSVTRLGVRR